MNQQLGLARERERAGRIGKAGRSKAGERLTGFFFSVTLACRMQTIIFRPQESDVQISLQMESNRATTTGAAQNCGLIHQSWITGVILLVGWRSCQDNFLSC
jgi:hypothetical protein